MTYAEAVKKINARLKFGSNQSLDRIKKLLYLADNPEKGIKYIHVAGTNGKGSVCYALENILKKANYKTGMYISPSINSLNERIRVNGECISDKKFAEIYSFFDPLTHDAFFNNNPVTEFEIMTAMAFKFFKDSECDIVVLETGMGGRLDATNVIDSPLCSVITSIDLDHTKVLGNSIQKIALEKCGIIKKDSEVIVGPRQHLTVYSTAQVFSKMANSPMYIADISYLENLKYSLDNGFSFSYKGVDLKVLLHGEYQIENFATICKTLDILRKKIDIPIKSIKEGFKTLYIPCRMEIVHKNPLVILDSAHNPAGADKLSQFMRTNLKGKNIVGVIGAFKDKDVKSMIFETTDLFTKIITVEPKSKRAMPLEKLTKIASEYNNNVLACTNIEQAVKEALKNSQKNTCIIFFGSFSIMNDVKISLKSVFGS
ncbi:MAG: bifunctional folylpolyglutamate synthase/dihydrofolate synthase [Acutalibacteraceae bacterium]